MNERILELANRANEDVGLTFKLEDAKQLHELMEKFAELIVRECAEVIDAQKPVWQNTDVPAEIALDMAAKNIKAYFGVTE